MVADCLMGPVAIGQGATVLNGEGRFRFYKRKKFFTMRLVRHWKKVSQRSSGCPVPGRLDGALSNLVLQKVATVHGKRIEPDDL